MIYIVTVWRNLCSSVSGIESLFPNEMTHWFLDSLLFSARFFHSSICLDKTIKLWRLSERQHEAYNFNRCEDESSSAWSTDEDAHLRSETPGPPMPQLNSSAQLRVPRFRKASHLTVEARPRRVFANAHTYHINAVSLNSDQETFLSSDDLRINLWNLDVSDQSFSTLVGLWKPVSAVVCFYDAYNFCI